MENQNAYLIYLGNSNYTANQDFMNAFNHVSHKTALPGVSGLYIVQSDLDLNRWYGFFGNVGTMGSTTGAVTMPLIIPVDVTKLQGIQGLPISLQTFVTQAKAA